jgi:phage terminase Nu1 subunit (DNA packaging protein)
MKHLISKTMVARMLGVTTKSISRWQSREKDPLPIAIKGARGVANQYDIAAVNDWGVRRALEKPRSMYAGRAYDYQKERARLTYQQAERAQLENAVTRGEMIPADQVVETWTNHVLRMRARLLALPSRMAPELYGVECASEVERMMLGAVNEALAELPSNGLPEEAQRRIDERGVRT